MFIAVWIIYAADRLLDARQLDFGAADLQSPCDLEVRHRFHHRYRSQFLFGIILGTIALIYLLHRIEARSLHLYVLLAAILGLWMLLIHARPVPSAFTRRLPKELAVGLFFPAAVFIPTVARIPSLRPTLFPAAALFACTCALNCLYLYAWEHPGPRLSAHWTTRFATDHLTQIEWFIFAITTALVLHSAMRPATPVALPAIACLLSVAAFILLNAIRFRIAPLTLRAFADLVLLTPVLLFPLIPLLSK